MLHTLKFVLGLSLHVYCTSGPPCNAACYKILQVSQVWLHSDAVWATKTIWILAMDLACHLLWLYVNESIYSNCVTLNWNAPELGNKMGWMMFGCNTILNDLAYDALV